jgi:carbon storage regulator
MLVLSRKVNQSIVIGDDVRVVIVSVDRDQVKLGIEAPREVTVHRSEVYEEIKQAAQRRPASNIRGSVKVPVAPKLSQ